MVISKMSLVKQSHFIMFTGLVKHSDFIMLTVSLVKRGHFVIFGESEFIGNITL